MKLRWGILFLALSLFVAHAMVAPHSKAHNSSVHKTWDTGDRYRSFTELSQHEVEGLDYSRNIVDRASPITVLAIHGGRIELGVSALVSALTDQHFNLYEFRGHRRQGHQFDLHVTSTRFDDPLALDLTRRAQWAVAIHSFWDTETPEGVPIREGLPRLCIGGLNLWLQTQAVLALTPVLPVGTVVEPNCQKFPGSHTRNIVNQAAHHGLQLEFSIDLVDLILADQALFDDVVNALRQMLIPLDTPPSSHSPPTKACAEKLI